MRTLHLTRSPLRLGIVWLVTLVVVAGPSRAAAQDSSTTSTVPASAEFAPLDAPGPELGLSTRLLDRTFDCPELRDGDRAVLLLHGTGFSAKVNFDWGWRPALERQGFAVCTIDLIANGLADAQVSAERVVFAIRSMFKDVGQPIGILGFSQGGAVARFALRFWPDLRPMVDDLVLLASGRTGSLAAQSLCTSGCPAAVWQFSLGSRFLAATNSLALTFPDVDYTNVYSSFDELGPIGLSPDAPRLPGAVNVAVQDICPADTADHLQLGTADPVGYALLVDALSNPGPAEPTRIATTVCEERYLPGVDEGEAARGRTESTELVAQAFIGAPFVTEEPDLRCYVTGTCAPATVGPPRDRSGNGFKPLRTAANLLLAVGALASAGAIVRHRREQARRRAD